MRKKDKIEKYLDRLVKLHGGELKESMKSRYYKINGQIIRVSDHFAVNSQCSVSIVLTEDGKYVLTNTTKQSIRCVEYKELLQFCKTFHMTNMITGRYATDVETINALSKAISTKDKTINELGQKLAVFKNFKPETIIQYRKQITELTNKIKELKNK